MEKYYNHLKEMKEAGFLEDWEYTYVTTGEVKRDDIPYPVQPREKTLLAQDKEILERAYVITQYHRIKGETF